MPREVTAGDKPQAVWLSDDADYEDDAFADLASKAIDPGPVLGREHAARWLERQGQRREATRMRLTGSTQPRRAPIPHVARPRERRPTSRQRTRAPTSDDPSPEPEPPLEVWRGLVAASARMIQHCERRRAKAAAC
jgi:hypothetical protein